MDKLYLHPYRSHTCGQLRRSHTGARVRLSGWVHQIRDHGHLVFIELRDHYGLTQCVLDTSNPIFHDVKEVKFESVVTVTGLVVCRPLTAINNKITTGDIEVRIDEFKIESMAEDLPIIVNSYQSFPEETRLKYRFLDLRCERMHRNIMLRSKIISFLRQKMNDLGFIELQTPILTSSSPEGARDYLVPSREYPGLFYALPQSPQVFKQILMASGFDRYFQIAPCFRDEDPRSDRLSGEFYQLDLEMSFVTQEDVFSVLEYILYEVYKEFSQGLSVDRYPFPRIPYDKALLRYGVDHPDLRNPLLIFDVSDQLMCIQFDKLQETVAKGAVIRAIQAKGAAKNSRSFFERIMKFAKEEGSLEVGYISFSKQEVGPGSINNLLDEQKLSVIKELTEMQEGDVLFFVCCHPETSAKVSGSIRQKLGQELGLVDNKSFRFCWIVDFPMFQLDKIKQKIDFAHNPFSMPQGGMEALLAQDPLSIRSYQYDIVCNGVELSSGSIRNHIPRIMYKVFEIAGYRSEVVEEKFSGLLQAFKYGTPPHGGCAPGIDRIVMLLANEQNLRDVVAFPLNSRSQDLMMLAPSPVTEEQLREVHIAVKYPNPKR